MKMYQRQTQFVMAPSSDQNRTRLFKRRRNSNLIGQQLVEANIPSFSTINFTENLPTFKNSSPQKSSRVQAKKSDLKNTQHKLEKSLPLKTSGSAIKVAKSTSKRPNLEESPSKRYKEAKVIRNVKEDMGRSTTGNFEWRKGELAQKRYEFIDILGKGSFGTVFKGYDHLKKEHVAIKVIRPEQQCQEMAETEINLLVTIRQKDPKDQRSVVRIKDFFTHRSRMCIVSELLSINLYEMLRAIQFKGMPLDVIRKISIQLLSTLAFLKSLRIIHGDIKPENIVLKEFNKTGIKLIDFGTSTFSHAKHYDYLMSRYYRAPEVILGSPYDEKIDMWSVGCVLAELYHGKPLFTGENEPEQIGFYVETIGLPPVDLIKTSCRGNRFFSEQGDVHNFLMVEGNPIQILRRNLKSRIENTSFEQFLSKILTWSPQQRITPEDALMDPWILEGFPKDLLPEHVKNTKRLKQSILRPDSRSFRTHKRRGSDLAN